MIRRHGSITAFLPARFRAPALIPQPLADWPDRVRFPQFHLPFRPRIGSNDGHVLARRSPAVDLIGWRGP